MPKVSVYIRNHQTRAYEPADAKTTYPLGTIFCLRYKKDGKRKWETLSDTLVSGQEPGSYRVLFQDSGSNALGTDDFFV